MEAPPKDVQTYQFSYSRSTGKMRFRLEDSEWLVSTIAGKWEILGTDVNTGNLIVRCKLRVEDDKAFVYIPKDVDVEAYTCDIDESRALNSHIRLCYNRQDKAWRVRDERSGVLHSQDIKDYKGVMSVNYFDGGPHIFHDGEVFIDEEKVAHFAP